jgi:hypothetical protein
VYYMCNATASTVLSTHIQVRLVYVDNPEQTVKILPELFPELGEDLVLPGGAPDSGIKLDPGHVVFSRFPKSLRRGHPLYCEYM